MATITELEYTTITTERVDADSLIFQNEAVILTVNRREGTRRTWDWALSVTLPEGVILREGSAQSIAKAEEAAQVIVNTVAADPTAFAVEMAMPRSLGLPAPEVMAAAFGPVVYFVAETGGVVTFRDNAVQVPLPENPMRPSYEFPTVTEVVEVKERKQGRRQFPDAMLITEVADNPKKAGTAAYERFALLKNGQTIGEAMALGVWYGDIRGGHERGFLKLVNPNEC